MPSAGFEFAPAAGGGIAARHSCAMAATARRSPVARATLLAALGLTLTTAPAFAQSAALPPLAMFGDESVAATDDARAYVLNPAALGNRYPSEWLLSWARRQGTTTHVTALATWRRLGFGFTRERDSSQSLGAGFSLGDERLRLGWASDLRLAARPGDERDWDHRAALLSRPSPWLSVGASAEHVTQPVFRGRRLSREYTLGLGLRPLAWSRVRAHDAGTRLTLTGDVMMREGAATSAARVRVGATLEPLRGLELHASAARGREFRLGVTLRGVRGNATAARMQVDGDRVYDSYTTSSHTGEDRVGRPSRAQQRVAWVRAGGVLVDEALGGGVMGGGGGTPAGPLHAQLERALTDPLTRGVFLELSGVAGMAQLEELRPKLMALKGAGKPVVAFMQYGGGRGDLYLSSAASKVYASPAAEFLGLGLRAERRYYKQALARFGVKMDRASIGEFKSAYRNLSVDSTPAPDTVVIQRMLSQRQELFVSAVTAARGITPERLFPILDGRDYDARVLARLGVIDSVGWREAALAELGRLTGLGKKPRLADLRRMPESRTRWNTPQRIAVVYAGGGIVDGKSGSDLLEGSVMGDQTIAAQLERAFKAPGVKAVVLRVDSPGGSSGASFLMDRAVERIKKDARKPLVVSMASVAASGGYFMSVHADRIYANRNTVTGSIGVLFVKPSFEGVYEKLGVRQQDYERGDYMRGMSPARNWRPQDQAAADSSIKRLYRVFTDRVRDGRKMEGYEVASFAQGRPWLGEDAVQTKLIDSIGGLDAAVAEARRLGGIPKDEKISFLEFRHPNGSFVQRVVGSWLKSYASEQLRVRDMTRAQARAEDWLLDLE